MPSSVSFWRELWNRSHLLDRLTAAYVLAFAIGLAVFGRSGSGWPGLFLTHFAIIAIIVGIVWYWREHRSGIRGFVRLLYPVMLYSLFYSELEVANFWVFPQFLDAQIVALEQSLFGVEPNLWVIPAQSAWLNELMMLGYFSYYLLIPIVALTLFFRRRSEDLCGLLFGTTVAFVLSYVGFVLYPVEGPRYFLADQFSEPLKGWVFVPLVRYIIDNGAIHGGCMPSSHVAVALVVLFWARRTTPKMGALLTPLVALLIVGTVWGRYHYVTDVFVGAIVGVTALGITGFWARVPVRERSFPTPINEAIVVGNSRANRMASGSR